MPDPQQRQILTHEAMATVFRLSLVHPEPLYARQAAAEAFAELERIEGRLSRFVESSDVFRAGRLARGQSTWVHPDTLRCLAIALDIQRATAGAFDVAYASTASPASPPDRPRWELDEKEHAVRVLADGVRLDLGGIGKGFALDRMAALLADWEIEAALLSASTSTVLALGRPPGEAGWPLRVGPDDAPHELRLAHRALSGSGTAVKGNHVLDPRSGGPATGWFRAWAAAPTAAVADALSTAFLVMTEHEVRDFCRTRAEISAYLLPSPEAETLAIAGGKGDGANTE